MKDLRWRVRFFELWLERGNPYAFSLPAFFFPQVLLLPLVVRRLGQYLGRNIGEPYFPFGYTLRLSRCSLHPFKEKLK